MINQMNRKFTKDCESQGNEGMISYNDLDINCSNLKKIDKMAP